MAGNDVEIFSVAMLDSVQSYLTCSICQDLFRDPRNLPCGHTFCLVCLQEMEISAKQNNPAKSDIRCPHCRAVYSFKIHSVQSLPKIYAIDNLVQEAALKTMDRRQSAGFKNGISYCSIHPHFEATLYCAQCVQLGCNTCAGVRHKNHTFVELTSADVEFTAHLESTLHSLRLTNDRYEQETETLSASIGSNGKCLTDTEFFLTRTRNDLLKLFDEQIRQFDAYDATTMQVVRRQQEQVEELRQQVEMRKIAMKSIKQKMDVLMNKLSPSASAADRFAYIQRQLLPSAASQSEDYVPPLADATVHQTDFTKWKSDVNEWFGIIADMISNAGSNLPQLNIDTHATHRSQRREIPPPSHLPISNKATSSQLPVTLTSAQPPTPSSPQSPMFITTPTSPQPLITTPTSPQPLITTPTTLQPPITTPTSPQPPMIMSTQPPMNEEVDWATSTLQYQVQPACSSQRVATLWRQQPQGTSEIVTVAHHMGDMAVNELRGTDNYVDVVSLSPGGQLMVGQWNSNSLYIYSGSNDQTAVHLPASERLFSAAWTHQGHIVCTTESRKVIVLTRTGDVRVQTRRMAHPLHISVSEDGVIYITDWGSGVHQSTDSGLTWSHVFSPPVKGWKCVQAVKVYSPGAGQNSGTTDRFWVLEQKSESGKSSKSSKNSHSSSSNSLSNSSRLRMYSVDRVKRSIVTASDVSLPENTVINFQRSRLAYDGHQNVYMTDWNNKAVHVFSVNGHYGYQLLSSQHFSRGNNDGPVCLAVDKQDTNNTMVYVGQHDGVIGVYKLTETNRSNV